MKIIYFTKPFLWLILICLLLYIPADKLPSEPFVYIPFFDKIVHFGLFFMFCLLLFVPFKKIKLRHILWAPVTAILTGALLELLQHTITNSRNSDIFDFLANSAGIFTSVYFYYKFVSGKKPEKLI